MDFVQLSPRELREEYFSWLVFHALGVSHKYDNYINLARSLHSQEFYFVEPLDENRLIEGTELRDTFEDELGYSTNGALEQACTILEMLVALAMDFRDLNNEKRKTSEYFMEMIFNLGLKVCTDDRWDETMENYTFTVVEDFLARDYNYDGSGGLFPLEYPREDQRSVELWYQLAAYYNEKYYDYDSEV